MEEKVLTLTQEAEIKQKANQPKADKKLRKVFLIIVSEMQILTRKICMLLIWESRVFLSSLNLW